jgi:hypothetical protein
VGHGMIARWLDWLRNPPDLVERAPAVQFLITIFPDYTGGLTASKIVQPAAPQITAITQSAFELLIQWARSQGVQIQIQGAPRPPDAKTANPLRGVRP